MIPEHLINQLFKVMDKYIALPDTFKEFLKPMLKCRPIYKGEYLFRIGDNPEMVYFVCSGCFQENTFDVVTEMNSPTWFWFTGYFIFTTPGFFSQQAMQSDVKALTDGMLIYITAEDFNVIKQKFDFSGPLSELIRDKDLRSRTNHGYLISHFEAKDVLKYFYNRRKVLFRHAKRKDIAKFLGIQYNTLRRLMNKIK